MAKRSKKRLKRVIKAQKAVISALLDQIAELENDIDQYDAAYVDSAEIIYALRQELRKAND